MTNSTKIGVGILLEHEAFNAVRELEWVIAENNDNRAGLKQPPHITIKRPFSIQDQRLLDEIIKQVERLAQATEPFHISYEGIASFSDGKTMYLKVAESKPLHELHRKVVEVMLALDAKAKHPAELTPDMVFHTTLALRLTDKEAGRAAAWLDTSLPGELRKPIRISRVGLFFSDDSEHWSVIREYSLQSSGRAST